MNVTSRASNRTWLIYYQVGCVRGRQKYITYDVYLSKSLPITIYMGECMYVFVSIYECTPSVLKYKMF
jgi:hypothetical protein